MGYSIWNDFTKKSKKKKSKKRGDTIDRFSEVEIQQMIAYFDRGMRVVDIARNSKRLLNRKFTIAQVSKLLKWNGRFSKENTFTDKKYLFNKWYKQQEYIKINKIITEESDYYDVNENEDLENQEEDIEDDA